MNNKKKYVDMVFDLIEGITNKSIKLKSEKAKVQPMLLANTVNEVLNANTIKKLNSLANQYKKDGKIIDKEKHDFNMAMIRNVQNNLKHATKIDNPNGWDKGYFLTYNTIDNDGKYKLASIKYDDIVLPFDKILGQINENITTVKDLKRLEKIITDKLKAFNK